jgi:hypothetical protein
MRKWFSVLTLLALLLAPAGAHAQSAIGFDSLDVSVRPEYDRTTVLVIYMIALLPKTPLPAEVTLRLPPGVDKAYAVAVGDSQTTVSDQNVQYKFTPGKDYSQVSITATGLFIRLEFYDPSSTKIGNQRQYSYQWPGDYSVDKFRFEFRQPLQSSNPVTDPVLTNIGLDEEGLQMSEFKQTAIKQDEKLSFNIKYQRDTDSPSTTFLKLQPSTPLDQNVAGQSTWTTYLPWALGAIGLVLLLIAGWIYLASSRENRAAAKTRKRHVQRAVDDVKEETSENGQVHCSQCGKRAQPGDRFCRACGARIRRVEA